MLKTAKGQITLVSLADGSSSMFFITPNKSTQQIFDSSSDTYIPNYSEEEPLILTPTVYVGKTKIEDATFAWKEGNTSLGISKTLAIKSNLTVNQRLILCTASYVDPNSQNNCTAETYVIVSRLTTSGNDVNVLLDPSVSVAYGAINKVDYIDQNNNAVAFTATAYYGSAEKKNGNTEDAVQYRWSIYDWTNNMFVGFSQTDAIKTGVTDSNSVNTYNKVSYFKVNPNFDVSPDAINEYPYVSCEAGDEWVIAIQNDTIVLKKDAIDVKETIRCEAEVYQVHLGAIGDSLGLDADIATVRDLTDDYTCQITATTMALTSNVQASKLTATMLQNGEDVTNKMKPNFDWDAYTLNDSTGEAATPWPEYSKNDNVYTLIKPGETEKGRGYWITGGTASQNGDVVTNPTTASHTGAREVTVYRSQVGNASNIECTLTW